MAATTVGPCKKLSILGKWEEFVLIVNQHDSPEALTLFGWGSFRPSFAYSAILLLLLLLLLLIPWLLGFANIASTKRLQNTQNKAKKILKGKKKKKTTTTTTEKKEEEEEGRKKRKFLLCDVCAGHHFLWQ